MSTFCVECHGSGERDMQGFLDCAAPNCTAATERAALDAHLLALGRLHERDVAWEAYKLGQAKALADDNRPDLLDAIEDAEREKAAGKVAAYALIDKRGLMSKMVPYEYDFFGAIMNGLLTHLDAEHADREWPGLAPHSVVKLFAAPANNNTEKADE